MPQNLLEPTWTDLDSDELRLLLREQFEHTPGQYDGDDGKLYLPVGGMESRVALTYGGNKIATVEPGMAFDPAEWEGMRRRIEHSLLAGVPKIGREYSFSLRPVEGSWRGARSGIQILPAPAGAPRDGSAHDPFILEFPIKGSDLLFITNHRRLREHRKFTMLLNLLLGSLISSGPGKLARHCWAIMPPDDNNGVTTPLAAPAKVHRALLWLWRSAASRFRVSEKCRHPYFGNIKWVQEGYFGPIDNIVIDNHSPASDRAIEEVDPGDYYTKMLGSDQLRVPTDLDAQICSYLSLTPDHREKFDRALFWLDMSARQWTLSVSAAFAALFSAIEALTDRGEIHHFNCPKCGNPTQHEVSGATRRFKDFIDTYAPDLGTARRSEMYPLRSGILHGSRLIEIDYALAFGWDLPWWNQRELHWVLSAITRTALRNWLKSHTAHETST